MVKKNMYKYRIVIIRLLFEKKTTLMIIGPYL